MITEKRVFEELETIMDPELGLDLVTLGLIYEVQVEDEYAQITMTFTTPYCPFAPAIKKQVHEAMIDLGMKGVEIIVTFDPPWEPPEGLRATLGL